MLLADTLIDDALIIYITQILAGIVSNIEIEYVFIWNVEKDLGQHWLR